MLRGRVVTPLKQELFSEGAVPFSCPPRPNECIVQCGRTRLTSLRCGGSKPSTLTKGVPPAPSFLSLLIAKAPSASGSLLAF